MIPLYLIGKDSTQVRFLLLYDTQLIALIFKVMPFILHPLSSIAALASLPTFPSLHDLSTLSVVPALLSVKSTYCETIGIGCEVDSNHPSVGRVARKLREEAGRASDIFQSIVELSDVGNMGLHQAEIWELAMTVRRGSQLEEKDFLAEQLVYLGDMSRDLKDKLMSVALLNPF